MASMSVMSARKKVFGKARSAAQQRAQCHVGSAWAARNRMT
jgi:hypothetical protein